MTTSSEPDDRARLYGAYVSARGAQGAPSDLAGLAPRAPYLRRLVREHFPADRAARILDLGCGCGALLHFARLEGYTRASGVDRSPEQVEAARRLGIAGVTLGDLATSLGAVEDASLDVVVCFDVLEHLDKREVLDFTDIVYRKLKKGGRWIVHAPNGESPFLGRVRYGDFTHEQAFTRESISQVARTAGFRDVLCFEDVPVVHGPISAARRALWHVLRTVLRFWLAVETGDLGASAIFSQNLLAVAEK